MAEPLPPLPVQLERLAALHRARELSDEVFAQCRAAIVQQLAAAAPPATAEAAPSWRLKLGVAGFALALAGAGYAWLGAPLAWSLDGAPAVAAHANDGSAHSLGEDQIDAMIDRLAARLEGGGDADAWAMLARSQAVRGRHDAAVAAFRKAVEGRPQDARLLVDFADALAMTQGGRIDGEPMTLIEAALKIDPDNVKGLALAGTAAFQGKDYREAVKRWERVATAAAPDDPIAENLGGSLDEARRLAGLPAKAAVAPAPATVSGVVTLTSALVAQASPDDTVFVFARAADGSRLPLAILRRKVSDLPIRFVLDDSLAMSPQARLSSARSVIVGARISKSGEAMPRAGDLEGQSTVVAVGTQGVSVEVRERVKAGS